MNLRDLPNETMVSITGPWATEGKVRARIEGYGALRGLLELSDAAHGGMVALTSRTGAKPNETRLAELTERAGACDARFDRALKGGLALCDAAALLVEGAAQQARVTADRAELYPSGAAMTQTSYANEAGAGVALEGKLAQDPKLARRASRIKLVVEFAKGPAQTFTVEGLAREQIAAAAELAAVEQERRELEEGAPLAAEAKVKPSAVSRARTAWIKAVGLMVDTANELPSFSDEDRRVVFGALGKALESGLAAKRAEARDEEEQSEEEKGAGEKGAGEKGAGEKGAGAAKEKADPKK